MSRWAEGGKGAPEGLEDGLAPVAGEWDDIPVAERLKRYDAQGSLMGLRHDTNVRARAIAANEALAALVSGKMLEGGLEDPESCVSLFVAFVRDGMKPGASWHHARQATNLFALFAKLRDVAQKAEAALYDKLRVRSLDEAAALLEKARSTEGLTDDQRAELCLAFLEHYVSANPAARRGMVERLGGQYVETSDLLAEAIRMAREGAKDAR